MTQLNRLIHRLLVILALAAVLAAILAAALGTGPEATPLLPTGASPAGECTHMNKSMLAPLVVIRYL